MSITSPPTNDPLLTALTERINSGTCVVIVGAGVSAGDYPLWSDLVSILKDRCGVRLEDLKSNDFLDIAEAAKKKNQTLFFSTLDDIFCKKDHPKTLNRYHLLARIGFFSYITLNYDPLLLDTLDLHRNINISEYPSLNNENHSNDDIFYIHGRLGPDRPAENTHIVLTRSEFDEAYDPYRSCLHSFLQTTFQNHDICFIGCDPSEQHIQYLLKAFQAFSERIHGLEDNNRPQWFLLWDGDSDPPGKLDKCGIRLVKYSKKNKSFSGLDQVLEYWAQKNKPFLRKPGVKRFSFDPNVEPER